VAARSEVLQGMSRGNGVEWSNVAQYGGSDRDIDSDSTSLGACILRISSLDWAIVLAEIHSADVCYRQRDSEGNDISSGTAYGRVRTGCHWPPQQSPSLLTRA
jgi:hypothetical protein